MTHPVLSSRLSTQVVPGANQPAKRALVSVYMPTRNRVHLLERALNSVLHQTYSPIEVIVVDDGSTDGTAELLADLQSRHANLSSIRHETSKGAPAARNSAIAAARGEFITGLDDDDEFTADRIGSFVADWQARQARGEVFSALYAQDIISSRDGRWTTRKPARVDWQTLWSSNRIANQVFTRRSNLQAIGMFDTALPMWQDLECWIRLTSAFGPAVLTDRVSQIIHIDASSERISSRGKDRLWQTYAHVVDKHAGHIGVSERRALFLQMYAAHYLTEVGYADFRQFLAMFGPHLPGLVELSRAAFRRALHELRSRLRHRT